MQINRSAIVALCLLLCAGLSACAKPELLDTGPVIGAASLDDTRYTPRTASSCMCPAGRRQVRAPCSWRCMASTSTPVLSSCPVHGFPAAGYPSTPMISAASDAVMLNVLANGQAAMSWPGI